MCETIRGRRTSANLGIGVARFPPSNRKFRVIPTYVDDEIYPMRRQTVHVDKTRSALGKRISATIRRDRFLPRRCFS